MAFTDLYGLVANSQRKAITYYLHGSIRCRHVEDNQFMAFYGNDKAPRLCRAQASTRCGEQATQRIRRKAVTSKRAVIFDAEDQDSAFGIGEGGDVFRNLVPHSTAVAQLFGPSRSFKQRLAVEVLTFVLV